LHFTTPCIKRRELDIQPLGPSVRKLSNRSRSWLVVNKGRRGKKLPYKGVKGGLVSTPLS